MSRYRMIWNDDTGAHLGPTYAERYDPLEPLRVSRNSTALSVVVAELDDAGRPVSLIRYERGAVTARWAQVVDVVDDGPRPDWAERAIVRGEAAEDDGPITVTDAQVEELAAISKGLNAALDLLPSCDTEFKVFEELANRLEVAVDKLDADPS